MCPQVELAPVRIVDAPLDLSLTSRWPLLARLSLHGTGGVASSIAEAVITSSGAEVTVRSRKPADTHRQLQGLVDGFIRPRWGRRLQHASLQPARGHPFAPRSLFRCQHFHRHCC